MAIDKNGNTLMVGDNVVIQGKIVSVIDSYPGDVCVEVSEVEFPAGLVQTLNIDYTLPTTGDNINPILTLNGRSMRKG